MPRNRVIYLIKLTPPLPSPSSHPNRPQFSPLGAFGWNLRSEFSGTVFRLPLRTPKQAAVSRLSQRCHGVKDIRTLLADFAKESAGMLLFLKNVERITVYEWEHGRGTLQQVTVVEILKALMGETPNVL